MPAEGDFTHQATHCRVAFCFAEEDNACARVIFANGDASDPEIVRHWTAQADLIIAADGGTRHALSAGVLPQVVIGDLDSLAEADREQLDRSGVQLIVYPTHKDYTDLELAAALCARTTGDGDHHLQRAGRKVGSIPGEFDAADSCRSWRKFQPASSIMPCRFR